MALLTWSESYTLGVVAIDADHKAFIELLNKLYDSILDGSADNAKIRPMLEEVRVFALEHCNREEELLQAAGYPDLDAIRKQHTRLHETIEMFQQKLEERKTISVPLANFLMEWVLQHILKEDKKCAAFLKRVGAH